MTRFGARVLGLAAILAVALAATVAAAAQAQPSTPDSADSRFTFHRADDGYLRLDGRTGQVSLCQRRPSGWQCQSLPDERVALEAEIARLHGDNAALRKELVSRALPGDAKPALPKSDGKVPPGKPNVDVRQIVDLAEAVWRRLAAFIAGVQRELQRWWI